MERIGGNQRKLRGRLLSAAAYGFVFSAFLTPLPVSGVPGALAAQESPSKNEQATRALFDAIRSGSLTAVRAQIALGADLEARNEDGKTPIGLAVALRETAIAETLNRIRAVQRAARDTAPEIRSPSVKVLRPGQSDPDNAPPVREARTITTKDGIVAYDTAHEEQIAKPAPPRAAFPNTPVWPPPPDYVLTVDGQRVPTNPAAQFAFDAPADQVTPAPVSPVAVESVAAPAPTRPAPQAAPVIVEPSAAAPAPEPAPETSSRPASGDAVEAATRREPSSKPQPLVETVRIPTTRKVPADAESAPPVTVGDGDSGETGLLGRIGSWFTPSYDVDGSSAAEPDTPPAVASEEAAAESRPAPQPAPVEASSGEDGLFDRLASIFQGNKEVRTDGGAAPVSDPEPVRLASADEPVSAGKALPEITADNSTPVDASAELPPFRAAAAEPVGRNPELPRAKVDAAMPERQTASLPPVTASAETPARASADLPEINTTPAAPVAARVELPDARAPVNEPATADISLPKTEAAGADPVAAPSSLPKLEAPAAAQPVPVAPVAPARLAASVGQDELASVAWPPAPDSLASIGSPTAPLPSEAGTKVADAAPVAPAREVASAAETRPSPRIARAEEPLRTVPELPILQSPEPVETGSEVAEVPEELPGAEMQTATVVAGPATETAAEENAAPGLFDRVLGFFTGGSEDEAAVVADTQPVPAEAAGQTASGGKPEEAAPTEVARAAIPAPPTEPSVFLPGEKRVVSGAWPPAPTEPVAPPPPMPAPVERVSKPVEEPVQTASIQEGPAPSRELPPPAWTTAPTVPVETFAFDAGVHLGHRIADGEAENLDCLTHIYRHRRNRIRACIVDVKWPREIRPDFVSNSIIYTGQKAVVIYQDGVAAAMYALFRTEAYDRVAGHFADKYGPSAEYRRTKVQLMAGGREVNEISVWRAKDPASGLAMEMEMRRFDDVRDLFGDPYHGMIEIRFAESRRVFQFVQPLDLMTNR
jgi:hypothetical protein